MDLNEFIENFANQFDDTKKTCFTSETIFKELDEWSSLIALSIIAMVDEEYEVQLKGDDIISSQSILDLYKVIVSKVSK